MILNRW